MFSYARSLTKSEMIYYVKYTLLVALILCGVNVFCATVTEFPVVSFDRNETEEITKDLQNPHASDLDIAHIKKYNNVIAIPKSATSTTWDSDRNPIFKAIRDFLFQVKPLGPDTGKLLDENAGHAMKMIEQSLIEATTILLKSTEGSDFATLATDIDNVTVSRFESNTPSEPIRERVGLSILNSQNKRQHAQMIANSTTACSNCYESLHSCIQKCFTENNCNDIQRNVRKCPPSPSRLCNPFTQWSPVDECKIHEDCTSPLLCCNDGCINKCVSGVWRS